MDATSLPVRFEALRNSARLILTPEINQVPWDVVEKCGDKVVAGLRECRATSLLVDLTPLDFLGSAQVALLARIWKALSAQQGKMVVHVTSPVVRDVLKTAGLHRLWRIVESHEQGLEKLGVNESGIRVVPTRWTIFPGLVALASLVVAAISWKGPSDWKTGCGWSALILGGLSVFLSRRAILRAEQDQRALGLLSLLVGLGAAATGGISTWSIPDEQVKIYDPDRASGIQVDDPEQFGEHNNTPTAKGQNADLVNPQQAAPPPSTPPASTFSGPPKPDPEADSSTDPGSRPESPARTTSTEAPHLSDIDEDVVSGQSQKDECPQRPTPPEVPVDPAPND